MRFAKGITLLELMIVVAIVAILGAVAYPSYTAYVAESRRAEAMKELMGLSLLQEQYYLDNGEYASSLAALGLAASGVTSYNSENSYYSITLSASAANDTFTGTATAIGSQLTVDEECKTFSVDDTGAKQAKSKAGSVNSECWK